MTDVRDRIDTVELADGQWLEHRWYGVFLCHRDGGGTLFCGDGAIHCNRYRGDFVPLWKEAEARISEEARAAALLAHLEEERLERKAAKAELQSIDEALNRVTTCRASSDRKSVV